MTVDTIIAGLVAACPLLVAFGMIKSDTGWLKRELSAHVAADEKKFDKLQERLDGHIGINHAPHS